jgi:outer membrane lipoprotein-sorting protein
VAAATHLLAAQPIGESRTRPPLELDGFEGSEKLRVLVEAVVTQQRSVHSLRADFSQLKKSALLLEPVQSEGEFLFRAPDTVRWDYVAPESMVVLLADDVLTTFLPGQRRAEAIKLSGRHKRFVAVLAGTQPLDELSQQFSITLADPGGGAPFRLTLVPTHAVIKKRLRSVVLEIDRTLLLPVAVEYNEADGDSTRYQFDHLELNPALDDGLFRLDLGADVKVEEIDASSGLG